MANVRNVYQTVEKVSMSKKALLENIVYDDSLSKKELRLLFMLLTELEGWSPPLNNENYTDPYNFRKVDTEKIADELDMKEKVIRKCMKSLVNKGLLEKGDSTSAKNGYRFTF